MITHRRGCNTLRLLVVAASLGGPSAFAEPLSPETTTDVPGAIWKEGVGPFVEVSFIVVTATPAYEKAHEVARRASAELGIPLDLRGLVHDRKHGLTWPKERCAEDPLYPFPCYVARGRWDPGRYVSIERSEAYASFEPGSFVVIAESGEPSQLQTGLASIQRVLPDAYLRTEEVYLGCMH